MAGQRGKTMKRFLLGAVLGALLAGHALADEPPASLFFTHDEMRKLAEQASRRAAGNANDIRLGAVFYYGPDDWVLWLQGQRWTPETRRDDVRVLSVMPGEVHLDIGGASGLIAHDVVLKPYQSYRLASGSVVEGGMESAR